MLERVRAWKSRLRILREAAGVRGSDLQDLASLIAALKDKQAAKFINPFLSHALAQFDAAPAMPVDIALPHDQEQMLWSNVAQVWSRLGASEPYWSVLTGQEYKLASIKSPETLETFYDSGRDDLDRFHRRLARNNCKVPDSSVCVEYGCGVGRCTVWLAKRFARVIALDVSGPHLRLAEQRAKTEGLTNIEFVQVKGEDELRNLTDFDVFYSVLVLQHNPPPLILSILRYAFAGLNRGGIAYFQVPTYAFDYSFDVDEYVRRIGEQCMEMHFVPQHAIFHVADAQGLHPIEVYSDHRIGNPDRWISTSFLLAKTKA